MANPYTYTFRRRVLLQVAMIAVLLGTAGLAALVTRSRTYAPPVALAPPVELAAFQVSLPEGWNVSREFDATLAAREQLVATESSDSKGIPTSRVLGVEAMRLGGAMSPRKYIRTVHSIQGEIESTQVAVDGVEGELFELVSRAPGLDTRLIVSHLYAVAVFDSGTVLVIHLEVPLRSINAADRRLVRDVAGAIKAK